LSGSEKAEGLSPGVCISLFPDIRSRRLPPAAKGGHSDCSPDCVFVLVSQECRSLFPYSVFPFSLSTRRRLPAPAWPPPPNLLWFDPLAWFRTLEVFLKSARAGGKIFCFQLVAGQVLRRPYGPDLKLALLGVLRSSFSPFSFLP